MDSPIQPRFAGAVRFASKATWASLAVLALVLTMPHAAAADWQRWVSGELRAHDERAATVQRALEELGSPTLGQTVTQFGYQHTRLAAPPLAPAWVQVDLGTARPIDLVALVPAQVDWQSTDRRAYGFPRRFRLDVSDDARFETFTPLATLTERNVPDPGAAPIAYTADGVVARYVRLTVTEMAMDDAQYFFALAELLVISGPLNVAAGRPVSVSASSTHPPRWAPENLTDGRTPLGPPIRRELLPWDGFYVAPEPGSDTATLTLDLGEEFPLQQVRLHGVHARIGADIPGFSFPSRFRVEVSLTPDFASPVSVFATDAFSNPGNNPVTLPAEGIAARFVRVTARDVDPSQARRFGLSEVEVYARDRNVARTATVVAAPDLQLNPAWPASLLVDGYTSYGRLLELPEWLRGWEQREALRRESEELAGRRAGLEAAAQRRVVRGSLVLAVVVIALIAGLYVAARRRRERELEQLRLRFARDLHDEIGSNLAGIAVLSEVAREEAAVAQATVARENWDEVHRIAGETLGAMREVLWVSGARQENGAHLLPQLRQAADRMLAGRELVWEVDADAWPVTESPARTREVFLFCKETLANVVRHSRARRVEVSVRALHGRVTFAIADNGVGFDPGSVSRGVGLGSLEMRARQVGGELRIESRPGAGTRVTLIVPVDGKVEGRLV